MASQGNPPTEEPSLLEQMQREFASIREELNAVKSSRSSPKEEDSEVSDLANLFDGLTKKLDEVLGFVKPKETLVKPPDAPPAAPPPKPRRPGFWA